MRKYSVYVSQSKNGRYYIGITEDINKRLKQHNTGISKWTKRYKNWRLVYKEDNYTLSEALKREKYIKRQKGGGGFFKIINNKSVAG